MIPAAAAAADISNASSAAISNQSSARQLITPHPSPSQHVSLYDAMPDRGPSVGPCRGGHLHATLSSAMPARSHVPPSAHTPRWTSDDGLALLCLPCPASSPLSTGLLELHGASRLFPCPRRRIATWLGALFPGNMVPCCRRGLDGDVSRHRCSPSPDLRPHRR